MDEGDLRLYGIWVVRFLGVILIAPIDGRILMDFETYAKIGQRDEEAGNGAWNKGSGVHR